MTRTIELVPYDPAWQQLAQEEAARVAAALGANARAVYHIGSTAVPGMQAKPIIDLLVEVRDLLLVESSNASMVALGYEPRGEQGIAGRRYFVRAMGDIHTHHVHVFQHGHPEIARHLTFRDYLIAHPEEAQAYSRLKAQLAQRFRFDPSGYTEAKSSFIGEIDARAWQWIQEARVSDDD